MSELFELSTSPVSAEEEVAVEPPVVPVEAPPVEVPPVAASPPPPPPASEEEEDSDTEEEAEVESEDETDSRGRLFIGPSDTVPVMNADSLRLRRQVAASSSPAIHAFSGGYMTDSELELDEYRVPDEGMLIEHTLSAEGLWAATVPIPVWVMVTVFIVFTAYLCLLIGTGILAVRGPSR
jgi:hypothetical protein